MWFLDQPIFIQSYQKQKLILGLWCTVMARDVFVRQEGNIFAYSYKSGAMYGVHLALYIFLRLKCCTRTLRTVVSRLIPAAGY